MKRPNKKNNDNIQRNYITNPSHYWVRRKKKDYSKIKIKFSGFGGLILDVFGWLPLPILKSLSEQARRIEAEGSSSEDKAWWEDIKLFGLPKIKQTKKGTEHVRIEGLSTSV